MQGRKGGATRVVALEAGKDGRKLDFGVDACITLGLVVCAGMARVVVPAVLVTSRFWGLGGVCGGNGAFFTPGKAAAVCVRSRGGGAGHASGFVVQVGISTRITREKKEDKSAAGGRMSGQGAYIMAGEAEGERSWM
jgi:hypothetical protein